MFFFTDMQNSKGALLECKLLSQFGFTSSISEYSTLRHLYEIVIDIIITVKCDVWKRSWQVDGVKEVCQIRSMWRNVNCDNIIHYLNFQLLFVIYMIIVAILLVNMLIAMMGNTYQKIAETRNEWQRQWARIVLVVERGVPPAQRLKQLMTYSQPMANGKRALVLRINQKVNKWLHVGYESKNQNNINIEIWKRNGVMNVK